MGATWHWWLPALLALLALLAGLPALQRLDLLAFDLLSMASPTRAPSADALIVAVDERSLQALGRWPWSRRVHGELIDRLRDAQARVVAFAILFDQPDTQDPSGDAALLAAVERARNVVLPLAPAASIHSDGMDVLLPMGELGARAAALGHVDTEVDADGLARRLYLRAGIGQQMWPALAQAVMQIGYGAPAQPAAGLRGKYYSTPPAAVWRRDYEVLLRLPAAPAVDSLSYVDVLRDPATAARLKGKVVFVGVSAVGIGSELATAATPRGTRVPAVAFQAQAFEALRNRLVAAPLGMPAVIALSLVALLAGPLTHAPLKRSVPALDLLIVCLPLLVSWALLLLARRWFPPMTATLGLAVGQLLWTTAGFKRTGLDLLLARRRAQAALDAVADGVVSVDAQGRIEYVNPVGQSLLGRPAAALHGTPLSGALEQIGVAGAAIEDALARCFAERRTVQVSDAFRLDRTPGCVVRVVVSPIVDAGQQLRGAVLALSDISEVVAATERLQHQATHDALTELPNRVLIRDRIAQGLANALRSGGSLGVLFVDLDNFKRINDSLGHAVGDRVLCEIAARLKSACRAGDTVGRWGGDEFVVVLADIVSPEALENAARKLLAVLAVPLDIEGMHLQLGATIGISSGPQDSSDPDQLLGMADMAMYRIKQRGGNRYGFVSADMNSLSRQRMTIELGLRHALANGELVVFYQPQIGIADGRLSGLEALVRWQRPGHGLVLPGEFIPIAEESDLILQLGSWVFDEVARQIRAWLDEGRAVVPVAVNVSMRQCMGDGLVNVVSRAIASHRIPPGLIELEITETTAMKDVERVESLLAQLTALGMRVALDDFGTGYSSLSHLRRFPISVLKIDQSFVHGAAQSADDAAIVRATIALAHNLGLKVVAEGVETSSQRDFLASESCDIAQGYFYGRPRPASDTRGLLVH